MASNVAVLVIGDVGCGKSTFINEVLQNTVVDVGHTMSACTLTTRAVPFHPSYPYPSIALVDTPGFNRDYAEVPKVDAQKVLQDWLEVAQRDGTVLLGIVYIHSSDQSRYRFPPPDGHVLQSLFSTVKKNVVIVSTPTHDGKESWKDFYKGFQCHTWGDQMSARTIVETLLHTQQPFSPATLSKIMVEAKSGTRAVGLNVGSSSGQRGVKVRPFQKIVSFLSCSRDAHRRNSRSDL